MELELKNDIKEIIKIEKELEKYGALEKLPEKTLLDLNLALEELVTNIISYSYDDNSEHLITVTFARRGDLITVTITDDGLPFNPLDHPAPTKNNTIEELEPGGLGIHLIKKLTDSLHYSRHKNFNIVTITKKIASPQPEGGFTHGNQQQ